MESATRPLRPVRRFCAVRGPTSLENQRPGRSGSARFLRKGRYNARVSRSDDVTPAATGMKLTDDDLLLFPDDGKRHEMIDGEHCVTPSPNLRYQTIVGALHLLIATCLEAHHAGANGSTASRRSRPRKAVVRHRGRGRSWPSRITCDQPIDGGVGPRARAIARGETDSTTFWDDPHADPTPEPPSSVSAHGQDTGTGYNPNSRRAFPCAIFRRSPSDIGARSIQRAAGSITSYG